MAELWINGRRFWIVDTRYSEPRKRDLVIRNLLPNPIETYDESRPGWNRFIDSCHNNSHNSVFSGQAGS